MIPRGIRNNNPGNIRKSPNQWLEKKVPSKDPEFEQFTHPRYGIRALGVLLRSYQKLYGLRNLTELIGRYAPGSENDTAAYVRSVSDMTGYGAHEYLNLKDGYTLLSIMLAIIRHENLGQMPYRPEIINEAMELV